MMPETCWDSVDNKHLIVASCWFSLSLHKKCVLIFSTTFVRNSPHSKKNWRGMVKIVYCIELRIKYPLFLSDFNETCILLTDSRKMQIIIKFDENQTSGSRVVTCGPTKRHDKANSRFPQICADQWLWTGNDFYTTWSWPNRGNHPVFTCRN